MQADDLVKLRLEILKLTHTHAVKVEEVLGKAAAYEKWVLAPGEVSEKPQVTAPAQQVKDQASGRGKKSGNFDILS